MKSKTSGAANIMTAVNLLNEVSREDVIKFIISIMNNKLMQFDNKVNIPWDMKDTDELKDVEDVDALADNVDQHPIPVFLSNNSDDAKLCHVCLWDSTRNSVCLLCCGSLRWVRLEDLEDTELEYLATSAYRALQEAEDYEDED